jgi:gliding motility-associated lipoprotein GldH
MLFIKPYFSDTKLLELSFTRKVLLVLVMFVMLASYSCNTSALYENNIHLDSAIWNMENKLSFDVTIQDTIVPYDFYLNLRHNDDYEYSNLFLFIDTYYPTTEYTRDTIEILLANAAGQWYGDGFGGLKEIRILLKKGVFFPSSGEYTFSIKQAMRTENLIGIEDFGIRIEKMQR